MQCVGQTETQAGSRPTLDAMNAEGAFVRIAVGMNEARVVRAGGQARLAADAFIVRDQHHAAALMHMACAGRAAGNAGRIVAVIAALGADLELHRGIIPMHFFRDPVAAVAFRHAVLGFAGHDAIMAAHAPAGIDHHAIARHRQASVSMVTKFTFMPVPPISGSVL